MPEPSQAVPNSEGDVLRRVRQQALGCVKHINALPKGRHAQAAYRHLLAAIKERRQARFGQDAMRNLRESLEPLAGAPTAQLSPLFGGLEPPSGGWRASVRQPETHAHSKPAMAVIIHWRVG